MSKLERLQKEQERLDKAFSQLNEKLEYLQKLYHIEADGEKRYSLKKQIENIEVEIKEIKDQLENVEQQLTEIEIRPPFDRKKDRVQEPFVPGYKHDIFISCFRANEIWVANLVQGIENQLETLLDRESTFSLWKSDDQLSFNNPVPDRMVEAIERTAIFVVILSPEYLVSERCQSERQAFLKKADIQDGSNSRIFIVERTRIEDSDRPREFIDLQNYYRFWEEDRERRTPLTFGEPTPDPDKLEDEPYYRQLNALNYDLVKELKHFKSSIENPEAERNGPDTRPAIFLAEVSDDLISQRFEVKQYLDQAGFKVLPEVLYFSEPDVFQQTVDRILEDCKIFVQLLSDLPGRKPPGRPSYNYLQYECARRTGKPIFQWHDPSLKLDTVTDRKHRELLKGKDVRVMNLEKFKQEIVKQALLKPVVKAPTAEAFIFLNVNREDRLLAQDISGLIKERGIACALPLQKGRPIDIRRDLEANLMDCDGVIIVYGKVPVVWARAQLRHCLKIMNIREHPMKALAVYEGPPEPKDPLGFNLPGMYIINYHKKESFNLFLRRLR